MEEDRTALGGGGRGGGLIGIVEIAGKGRTVIASKPLKAGEIVLRDSPLLLYSALPPLGQPQPQPPSSYCSNCFRILQQLSPPPPPPPPPHPCPNCSTSFFCSHNCRSIALTTSHTPWACQALTRLTEYYHHHHHHHHHQLEEGDEDFHVQSRFLIAAYNLSLVSPSSFQSLLSLQGSSSPQQSDITLHSLISSLFAPLLHPPGFSLELTALLLSKDKLNAFGLMEPFSQSNEERSVRAYGIYPLASFFNHDCLPNACRFDYLDHHHSNTNNTDIVVRLIHDVPAGRELCLSYFPVNLKYSQRQRRLRDDYGFICDCDRCKVEANWSDEEEEEEEDGMADSDDDNQDNDTVVMNEDSEEHNMMAGSEETGAVQGGDDFPHAYFFLRYMCNRNNCWGTLAPLPPSGSGAIPSTKLECNVCGNLNNCNELMDGEVSGNSAV